MQDWYGLYTAEPKTDPAGPATGSARVLRGGSWQGHASSTRSAYRIGNIPSDRYSEIGFRLARTQ